MTEVVKAHRKLLEIAGMGREYQNDEVWLSLPQGSDGTKIVGTGHDFEQDVQVVDRLGVARYAGKAALRLIALTGEDNSDPRLLLRTRLTWETEQGEHSSSASYDMTARSAADLEAADDQPSPYRLLTSAERRAMLYGESTIDIAIGLIDEDIRMADDCGAAWSQSYPGYGAAFGEVVDDVDESWRLAGAEFEEIGGYHHYAIEQAKTEQPQLLTMLTSTELAVPEADDLPKISEWVEHRLAAQ